MDKKSNLQIYCFTDIFLDDFSSQSQMRVSFLNLTTIFLNYKFLTKSANFVAFRLKYDESGKEL